MGNGGKVEMETLVVLEDRLGFDHLIGIDQRT